MISRIWHGWTPPANADSYESLLKGDIFVGIQNRRRTGGDHVGVLAMVVLALAAAPAYAETLRAGIGTASTGGYILSMDGPPLGTGTMVTLVTIEDPQQVHGAIVARRLTGSDVMAGHNIAGPYYELVPEPGREPLPRFAVAILGHAIVARVGTAVTLRMPDDPVGVRVRGCASSEGLHLTIWAGEPLKSRRLWHSYYYLGYDVEPTCETGDY